MGEIAPYEDKRRTHTICDLCHTVVMRQLEGINYDQYLEGFDCPIVIVDSEGRVAAVNQQAGTIIDKSTDMMVGFLGGEAMECAYARLEEGCGEEIHCETCTIRNLVDKTREEKATFERMPVQLKTEEGIIKMSVTTEYSEGLVKISILGLH